MRYWISLLVLVCLFSCKKSTSNDDTPKYYECNYALDACVSGDGEYCLFGFKWGKENNFIPTGYEQNGPQVSGDTVSFSFQESNGLVNTHSQSDLPSKSFNNLIDCAKTEIRKAFNDWSNIADIDFVELDENSNSDIQIFVADIKQSGVGYPNFSEYPCDEISGDLIFSPSLNIENCATFYALALHEIGHVLGLGHVNSYNIMNPDFYTLGIETLQNGDIEGLIQIYGNK